MSFRTGCLARFRRQISRTTRRTSGIEICALRSPGHVSVSVPAAIEKIIFRPAMPDIPGLDRPSRHGSCPRPSAALTLAHRANVAQELGLKGRREPAPASGDADEARRMIEPKVLHPRQRRVAIELDMPVGED